MSRPVYEPSLTRTDRRLGFTADQLLRRPAPHAEAEVSGFVYHLKVFADFQGVITGNGRFVFFIPEDMDAATFVDVAAGVTVASSGVDIEIQVHRIGGSDMLSTPITIDAGDYNSATSGTPPVIDPGEAVVAWLDRIAIDVDQEGANAQGLEVVLSFDAA